MSHCVFRSKKTITLQRAHFNCSNRYIKLLHLNNKLCGSRSASLQLLFICSRHHQAAQQPRDILQVAFGCVLWVGAHRLPLSALRFGFCCLQRDSSVASRSSCCLNALNEALMFFFKSACKKRKGVAGVGGKQKSIENGLVTVYYDEAEV